MRKGKSFVKARSRGVDLGSQHREGRIQGEESEQERWSEQANRYRRRIITGHCSLK